MSIATVSSFCVREKASNCDVSFEPRSAALKALSAQRWTVTSALRLRINHEAAQITELLDESSVTKEAPIFERARSTTRVADVVVQRFSSFIDTAVQESSFGEAQEPQLLRMRLIRDYSGLWLLVNRPSSN